MKYLIGICIGCLMAIPDIKKLINDKGGVRCILATLKSKITR